MSAFLNKYWFLKSRKFWTFIGSVVIVISTAAAVDPFPVREVIISITTLAVGYMGTVAYEDGAAKHALALELAAKMEAETASRQAELLKEMARVAESERLATLERLAAQSPVVVQVPPIILSVPEGIKIAEAA